MTFSDFVKLLYPYCGNGDTPSNFLVALFGAATTESDDPLFDKSTDYLKRIYEGKKPVTKTSASYILTHLKTANGLDTYIFDLLSEDALIELCGKFEPYIGNATKDDISTKIATLFVSIIEKIAKGKSASGLPAVVPTSMLPTMLSTNVDSILLSEVSMCCPVCGKLLMRKFGSTNAVGDYRITEIYPSNPSLSQTANLASIARPTYNLDSLDNKIVLCLICENEYLSAFNPAAYKALLEKKLESAALFDAVSRIDKVEIENSLAEIVKTLASISEPELSVLLRFDALKVEKKILQSNVLLKNKILAFATQFYLYIEGLLAQASKRNSVLGDRLPKAVQFASDELIARGLPQPFIFDELTKWLKNKTKSKDDIACEIMVSFFVQNCEVFYEITE